MEYRKTGRGGAGNYYTQQNLDKVTKGAVKGKDVEVPKPKDDRPPPLQPPERKSSFALTGRGGVGNLTDRDTLAKSTVQNASLTPGMQERKPTKTGYLGRGGMGNYKDEDAEKAAAQAAKRASESASRQHQEAVEMVDMKIREPEPAHLSGGEDDF